MRFLPQTEVSIRLYLEPWLFSKTTSLAPYSPGRLASSNAQKCQFWDTRFLHFTLPPVSMSLHYGLRASCPAGGVGSDGWAATVLAGSLKAIGSSIVAPIFQTLSQSFTNAPIE